MGKTDKRLDTAGLACVGWVLARPQLRALTASVSKCADDVCSSRRLKGKWICLVFDKQRKKEMGTGTIPFHRDPPWGARLLMEDLAKRTRMSQSVLIVNFDTNLPWMNTYRVGEIRKEGSCFMEFISFFPKLLPYRNYSYPLLRKRK